MMTDDNVIDFETRRARKQVADPAPRANDPPSKILSNAEIAEAIQQYLDSLNESS